MADSHVYAETIRRIHEGYGDEFFEVAPDPDAGERVEVRLKSPDGTEVLAEMRIRPEAVPLLCQALTECAMECARNRDREGS